MAASIEKVAATLHRLEKDVTQSLGDEAVFDAQRKATDALLAGHGTPGLMTLAFSVQNRGGAPVFAAMRQQRAKFDTAVAIVRIAETLAFEYRLRRVRASACPVNLRDGSTRTHMLMVDTELEQVLPGGLRAA